MWPFIIVVVVPSLRLHPYLINGSEDVGIQNRPAEAAVEALDITVLSRTPRLCVQYPDAVGGAPFLELLCDELRTVVAPYVARLTM